MQKTKIPYADFTWNPIRGCSKVGAGCLHCYAERHAMRFCGEQHFEGMVVPLPWHGYADKNGWTGKVALIEKKLDAPWRRNKSAKIFISMGDVFHEALSFESIDKVFAGMAIAPQHEYIILTKRSAKMREYMTALINGKRAIASAATRIRKSIIGGLLVSDAHGSAAGKTATPPYEPWRFLTLGVSCSTQAEVDRDVPILLDTSAAKRVLSLEPLLEAIVLGCPGNGSWLKTYQRGAILADGQECLIERCTALDGVIVGGESGPKARPYHVEWGKSLLRQCREVNTAFYMKQQGSNAYRSHDLAGDPFMGPQRWRFKDSSGSDPSEWPEDLRVREWPT